MKNINWVQKLSSRKFWAAVVAYVTSLLTAFNMAESNVSQIALIISGIGALAVYMFAEGMVDQGRNSKVILVEDVNDEE